MTISKRSELKWAGVKEENTNTFISSLLKFIEYLVNNGLSLKNAAKIIADIFDFPRKDIYNIWIDKN